MVPSYRGAPRLGALCARLLPVLETLAGELMLVDDCSDDATWPVMLETAAAHPNVGCLRLARRSGQQVATLAGCAAAAGRWIVTLDDDLEHDPREIPRLLARAEQGCDLVYGVPRRVGTRPVRPLRELGSRLFGLGFQLLIGKPRGLKLTGFRVMSAALVARMLAERVSAVYVSALALRQRPRVSAVPVTPGAPAPSRTPVSRLVRTFVRTMLGYGPLGRPWPGRPVGELLPIAEIRRPAG